jgi:hypothetical protein
MTLLAWSLVVVEGKTRRSGDSGGDCKENDDEIRPHQHTAGSFTVEDRAKMERSFVFSSLSQIEQTRYTRKYTKVLVSSFSVAFSVAFMIVECPQSVSG